MCSTVQEQIPTCGQNAIVKIGERTNIRPQKQFSHWTSTYRKIWAENSVFAIQHIENRKSFTEVLSPP